QEPGAPQFKVAVETGQTKEGEAFAAGSSAADLPKCVVTGGAATLTVSYQGKTYPLCCSGCRDEVNENPEKYIKKAALLAGPRPRAPGQPALPTHNQGRRPLRGPRCPPQPPARRPEGRRRAPDEARDTPPAGPRPEGRAGEGVRRIPGRVAAAARPEP